VQAVSSRWMVQEQKIKLLVMREGLGRRFVLEERNGLDIR